MTHSDGKNGNCARLPYQLLSETLSEAILAVAACGLLDAGALPANDKGYLKAAVIGAVHPNYPQNRPAEQRARA